MDPSTFNQMAYVGGSPFMAVDPSGLEHVSPGTIGSSRGLKFICNKEGGCDTKNSDGWEIYVEVTENFDPLAGIDTGNSGLAQTNPTNGYDLAQQYIQNYPSPFAAFAHANVDRDSRPNDMVLRDAGHYLYARYLSFLATLLPPDMVLGNQALILFFNLGYDPLKLITGNLFGTATPPSLSSWGLGFRGQWDGAKWH